MALILTSRQLQLKAEALLRQLSGRYLDLKVSELWRVVTPSGYLKNDSISAKVQYAIGSTSVSLHQCIAGGHTKQWQYALQQACRYIKTSQEDIHLAVAICTATSVALHQCIAGGIQSSGNMHCNKRVVTSMYCRGTYKAVAICIATSVALHQCIAGGHTKQWQYALQQACR